MSSSFRHRLHACAACLTEPTCAQAYAPQETKLRISFIGRRPGVWNSRAVLNEDEVMEAMQQRYPNAIVDLVHMESYLSKSEAILAVARTHVLIGMHGAGRPGHPRLTPAMRLLSQMMAL